jgi:hypothetical protein
MKIAQALEDWQASPRARQIPRMILALLHDLDGGAHHVGRALLVSDDHSDGGICHHHFTFCANRGWAASRLGMHPISRDETAAEHKLKGLDRPKLN